MSPAPDVVITRAESPPPRSVDIDTGKLFLAGQSERGPIDRATTSTSLAQWVSQHGGRQSFSTNYDDVDAFFREGGAKLIYGRVAGPAAAKAKRNLLDSGAAVSLIAEAKGVGSYGNSITVQVTHPTGTTFQFIIVGTNGDGTALTETSPEFATTADAVAWSNGGGSALLNLTQGASTNDPDVLAAAALGNTTAGTDDRSNIGTTQKTNALNLFTRDFGPGQVCYASATDTATHALVEQHAESFGRVGALDAPDTATVATITAVAATDRTATGGRSSALFAPWITIPGLTPGTTRTVSPAVVAAALMARSDGTGNSPNVPAAADNGQLHYATGLSQAAWSDANRDTLNQAGVDVFRSVQGSLELYGFRTLADPTTAGNWLWLSNARFFSRIYAQAQAILEGFQYSELDGAGHLLSRVKSALTGMLIPYFNDGSLYGATAREAFNVDMSGNTADTAAAGRLLATLALKMSPLNERTELTIVKVPVGSPVA